MLNNIVFIIFDSCRYDSFVGALTPNISRLGQTQKAYSYASWTFPSHAVYLMGASPHGSQSGVFASTVYREDFSRWSKRMNCPDVTFKKFVPELSLPAFLKTNGYLTRALVSLPVLNQSTILSQHFDSWDLMPSHNDFNAIIDRLAFDKVRPTFYFLNVGETHYPYSLTGESNELPRLHGVHGVFKHMDEAKDAEAHREEDFFNAGQMKALHEKQKRNVSFLDGLFPKLYSLTPENTWFIVTSDHGDCFGENGYFGHGPIMHEKVFEIFMVEGLRP